MKVKLLQIYNKERERGRGFTKYAKERWDRECLEHAAASMQKLRDKAVNFQKELPIVDLIFVR